MAEKTKTAKKKTIFTRLGKYFRDTAGEFKKIVWPSRKQVFTNCVVVLTMVVIFAILTWGLDTLFGWLREMLINNL